MAHIALGDAAQEAFGLDQVAHVLPDALPHKRIGRPSAEERLRWLSQLAEARADRVVASCPTGLVIDVVQAFREALDPRCEIFVITGRDAAERCVTWDYGGGQPFSEQIKHYKLLVASRRGAYAVAPELANRILPFKIAAQFDTTSSSGVRQAIRSGTPWHHMVPPEIRDAVGTAYEGLQS